MKLVIHKRTAQKAKIRAKAKVRIRKKIYGTGERPRLSVFRSSKHMYAQLIDDVSGKTLLEASTVALKSDKSSSREGAKAVGEAIAKKAQEKNINSIVFDRNGFLYHGRVKELAEAARSAGLNF